MRAPHGRVVVRIKKANRLLNICCAAHFFVSVSCSGVAIRDGSSRLPDDSIQSRYSIVCIIHGDGNYLFHDTAGKEYRADAEALKEAKIVAEQNPFAEVFIFHQKPKKNFLLFFPIEDGEFYDYRNGNLITQSLYWREHGVLRFNPEVMLYHQFRAERREDMTNMFLCYGHEIPEFGGTGYDASHADRTFTLNDLAVGVQGFTQDSIRFDLMVLSSCFGGTPHTIDVLGSFARYIIASPENLHLSYFDLRSLARLDTTLFDKKIPQFAQKFAVRSFERLTKFTQTAVSVAVYDIERTKVFLDSVRVSYETTLTMLNKNTDTSMEKFDRCDCAELPAYALPTMSEGVEILYRSAIFGRSRTKTNHSGWACWKENSAEVGFIDR